MPDAKDPTTPWFIRLAQIQDTIDGARAECGCDRCLGSGEWEAPDIRPCDYALEIAASLMALWEIQQQRET